MATETQAKKIQCGYCRAEIDVPPFASIITCEFCGTSNEIRTGKIIQNHHMLNVFFSGTELTDLIPSYLSKFTGVPPDFANKVIFLQFELRMMPFWVYKFDARTEYQGIGRMVSPRQPQSWSRNINFDRKPERGTIDMDQTCLIFGYREQYKQIRDEKIPVGAKEAFSIQAVRSEGGQIFDTEIGYDDAFAIAEARVKARHQQLMLREVDQIQSVRQDIKLKEFSYLHVPFYRVTYSYGNWKGEALVDAARGKVLRAEYPISSGHRFWNFLGIIFALGIIGAGIYLSLISDWYIAGYAGIAIFAGFLIFMLKEIFTQRKVAAE